MNKMKYSLLLLLAVLCLSVPAAAQESTAAETAAETTADASALIAGADERTAVDEVGKPGREPLTAEQLVPGTYHISVESSSSMFQFADCELTVPEPAEETAEMTAVVTLTGTGYRYLYMGTAEEAIGLDETAYSEFKEDAEGRYTYEIPVSALDTPLPCVSWSIRKEKWYDHQVVFDSDELPEEAFIDGRPYETEAAKTGGSLIIVGQEAESTEAQK